MRSIDKDEQAGSSMVGWLNSVRMSEADRVIAKAYARKTEAMLDLIWLAGAKIRAVFARGAATGAPVGTGLGKKQAVAVPLR